MKTLTYFGFGFFGVKIAVPIPVGVGWHKKKWGLPPSEEQRRKISEDRLDLDYKEKLPSPQAAGVAPGDESGWQLLALSKMTAKEEKTHQRRGYIAVALSKKPDLEARWSWRAFPATLDRWLTARWQVKCPVIKRWSQAFLFFFLFRPLLFHLLLFLALLTFSCCSSAFKWQLFDPLWFSNVYANVG